MKYLFLILTIVSLFSCRKAVLGPSSSPVIPVPWNDSSSSHPKHAALTTLIRKYNKLGLPGISLLVKDRNGTWTGAAGKADIGHNIAFTPGTVSKAASITKLMVGALVFRLMEDSVSTGIGYSDLHNKISKWLPSRITGKIANGDKITLGQCLKHETGIPDLIEENSFYLAVLNNPTKKWSPEELLMYIYDKPALFMPGDTAVYSNTNYVLVAMVIEALTGRKHHELLKQYILYPLDMLNTFYQGHDALPDHTAQGYFDLYNNNTIVNVSNIITGSGNGYGGIFSNLFDLYRFAEAFFIQQTLLQTSSFTMMQTWGKQDGSNLYGYGLQKSFLSYGIDAGIGHKGRDLGYTANLFYFPNKGVLHIFFINYGTDAKSNLQEIFYRFQDELVDMTLN